MSGGGFTASVFLYLYPDKTREAMKKLAILCVLACALVACEKEKTMSINEEENEIKTVSFYTEMRTRYHSPKFLLDFKDIIGSGDNEVAKDGIIYLVTPDTWDIIGKQSPLSYPGSWIGAPTNGNYFDNKDDLIAGFKEGRFPTIATIPATHGHLKNIPYGQYVLVGALGIYHQDTLKTYRGSFLRLTIDDSFVCDSIVLNVVCNDNEIAFWQNSELID